jgi:hypothetical protein
VCNKETKEREREREIERERERERERESEGAVIQLSDKRERNEKLRMKYFPCSR